MNRDEKKGKGNPFDFLYMIVVMALLVFLLSTPRTESYGEQDGPWTANEKRQVITLLEQIEENTR